MDSWVLPEVAVDPGKVPGMRCIASTSDGARKNAMLSEVFSNRDNRTLEGWHMSEVDDALVASSKAEGVTVSCSELFMQ
jgi:hypothetical protein